MQMEKETFPVIPADLPKLPDVERAYVWAKELCRYAQQEDAFFEEFWNKLIKSKNVYEEFIYYLQHGEYKGEYAVEGCTIMDIMIWQIDRFKWKFDQGGLDGMKTNKDKMVLMAYNTMLNMELGGTDVVAKMQKDTGIELPYYPQ